MRTGHVSHRKSGIGVLRVEILKPNGGVRKLGIPTAMDRVIEQAIVQVLSPACELHFSEYSYGFRPGRSAQQAILKLLEYFNDVNTWIADIDLEKFFDNVPQDRLMSHLNTMIHDSDVEFFIRKYLKAGVMVGGKYEKPIWILRLLLVYMEKKSYNILR